MSPDSSTQLSSDDPTKPTQQNPTLICTKCYIFQLTSSSMHYAHISQGHKANSLPVHGR